jgi:OTU domain-containing protein 5
LDYIDIERKFYANYVVGGIRRIDDYLEWKRQDGVWGDDIELQAISEIYNRPIELYAYSSKPMRTFHESNY